MTLDTYDCELCILMREERVKHLFFRCNFARNCWASIGIYYPLQHIKRSLGFNFYLEVIILMCWSIWRRRNDWIFNNMPPSVQGCKDHFIDLFCLMLHRAKGKYFPHIRSWLDGLL